MNIREIPDKDLESLWERHWDRFNRYSSILVWFDINRMLIKEMDRRGMIPEKVDIDG